MELPRLIQDEELDLAQLGEIIKEHCDLEGAQDAWRIMFLEPSGKEIVVHYLENGELSLLIESESKRVVGVQIENFRAFLKIHPDFKQLLSLIYSQTN